jgi:hypothetical protein
VRQRVHLPLALGRNVQVRGAVHDLLVHSHRECCIITCTGGIGEGKEEKGR